MEQLVIASASLILLIVGLIQAYQKSIENNNKDVEGLRKELYKKEIANLHLKNNYVRIQKKYEKLRNLYRNLATKYNKLIESYKQLKEKSKNG